MDTTRDTTTGIRIGELEVPGILVELSGELDLISSYQDGEQFYLAEASKGAEAERSETLALAV